MQFHRSKSAKHLLSGMVVVALAVLPPLLEIRGTALTLRQIGDSLGWLGAGVLSSSVLLMVREPLIARWFGGLARMYRWHHLFGVLGCAALVLHPAVLAVAALSTSPQRAWNIVSPARAFPSNALGWAALIGLILVLVTTVSGRLRYSLWRRLHFYSSLAVLPGIAHAGAYRGMTASLVLIAAPIVLALGWRILRADQGLGARPYEVQSLARIASRTTEIVLRPLAQPITVSPGQFVMVAFFEGPHYEGCGEFHPYTVCDSRNDGTLALAVKALGDCTTQIQSVQEGVSARVQGPFGQFLAAASPTPSLWIAGGIGITPFIARLRAGDLQMSTELIYTYRSLEAAPYLHELQEHARHQPLLVLRTLVVEDDPHPLYAMLEELRDLSSREVYIAGPPAFIGTVVQELHRRGVTRSHIHFEELQFLPGRAR
jgi:predicted ferric reductase